MKIRRIFIVSTLIITLFSLYLYIGGWPIVLNNNKTQMLKFSNFNNLMFNPLNNIDFSSGENKVFLVFSLDDINELPGKIIKRKVLVCSDNEVLKLLKNNFTFKISGGDMATVNSEIIVFSNNELVLKTNIFIDKNLIGIQDKKTGWAKAMNTKELYDIFSQFKPYRKVFLSLK